MELDRGMNRQGRMANGDQLGGKLLPSLVDNGQGLEKQGRKMSTTTKRHLVERIAANLDLPRETVRTIVQEFMDAIVDELAAGNRREFREFGCFDTKLRAARTGQNPRTLEKVPVPERQRVRFKPGRLMKESLEKRLKDKPQTDPNTE
jgi:integration host factor subunit beta